MRNGLPGRCGEIPAEPLRSELQRIAVAAQARAHGVSPLNALHQCRRSVPVGTAVGPARRRSRLPGPLAEDLEGRERGAVCFDRYLQAAEARYHVVGGRLVLGEWLEPGLALIDQCSI